MKKLLYKTVLAILAITLGICAFLLRMGAYILRWIAMAHSDAARDLEKRALGLWKLVIPTKSKRKKRTSGKKAPKLPQVKKVKPVVEEVTLVQELESEPQPLAKVSELPKPQPAKEIVPVVEKVTPVLQAEVQSVEEVEEMPKPQPVKEIVPVVEEVTPVLQAKTQPVKETKQIPKPKLVAEIVPVVERIKPVAETLPDADWQNLEQMTVKQLKPLCEKYGIVWKHARGKNKHMLKADMVAKLRLQVPRDLNSSQPNLRIVS